MQTAYIVASSIAPLLLGYIFLIVVPSYVRRILAAGSFPSMTRMPPR